MAISSVFACLLFAGGIVSVEGVCGPGGCASQPSSLLQGHQRKASQFAGHEDGAAVEAKRVGGTDGEVQTAQKILHSANRTQSNSTKVCTPEKRTDFTCSKAAFSGKRSSCLKKGLTLPPWSQKQCADMQLFKNDNYGWWYSWQQAPVEQSWGADSTCQNLRNKSQFIPMVKNTRYTTQVELDKAWLDSPYILGFNEPYGDHTKKKTGQAQMTPLECVDGMKKIVEKLRLANRTDIEIVAPVVNPKPKAMKWYREFFDLAVKDGVWCKFAYINVHYYTCDARKMMKKLRMIYNVFKLPIWLTEFNCNGMSKKSTTADQHKNYMKELLPQLEATDYVVRYSWYTLRNGVLVGANLAEGTDQKENWKGNLTGLGLVYDQFGPSSASHEESTYLSIMDWFASWFR